MSNVTPILSDDTLNGASGPNRSPSLAFSATNDFEAIDAFCADRSEETTRAYRRECERLHQWCRFIHCKALSSLNNADLVAYQEFIRNPPPEWCRKPVMVARKFYFNGPASLDGERRTMRIINGLFTFLVARNYIKEKPYIRISKELRTSHVRSLRRVRTRQLQPHEVKALFTYLDSQKSFWSERTRFAIELLFGLGLRVSEASSGLMNCFEKLDGRWSFYVVDGKGGLDAEQPVPDDLLKALMRWRGVLGLSFWPDPRDETPLICSQTMTAITDRQIRADLKKATVAAAELLDDEHSREQMKACSPHWLRHMYASQQARNGVQIEDIKKNCRHSRVETTFLYIDADNARRAGHVSKLSLHAS